MQGYSGGGSLPAAQAKTGVRGYARQDASATGVKGQSTLGRGVLGHATSGIGVLGQATTGRGGAVLGGQGAAAPGAVVCPSTPGDG